MQSTSEIFQGNDLKIYSCFLDALNDTFKAEMSKLEKMMCNPIPDSNTEWYIKLQNNVHEYDEI